MDFRSIELDLMEQFRTTTYELGVRKFPFLIEERDLNGSRPDAEKMFDEQVGGKRRQTHPTDDLEAVHL